MPKLTSEQQQTIILRLACHATSTEIQAEFKERWDVKLTYPQISYYDPLGAQGSLELKDEWKDLFWKAREKHDETVLKKLPFSNQDYRLMLYNRIATHPTLGMGKYGLKALEQGTKDLGGLYTRSGAHPDAPGESPDSLDNIADDELDQRIAEGLARRQSQP